MNDIGAAAGGGILFLIVGALLSFIFECLIPHIKEKRAEAARKKAQQPKTYTIT